MKYLKVRIRNHPKGVNWARKNGEDAMIYPDGYHNVEFETAGYVWDVNDIVADETYSVVLAAVKDNASGLDLLMQSDDVEEMTVEAAKQFSEDNQTRMEKVTDEAKVRRIEIKVGLGQALTDDELKAIDQNDSTPGIEIQDILADKFDKIDKIKDKLEK